MLKQVSQKQVTVFLENRAGRLAAITGALGEGGVDILAFSLADTAEIGMFRMVVSDPDKAVALLKEAGFSTALTEIAAVDVPDRPGGLAGVLRILEEANVNVEYFYAFVGRHEELGRVAFRFDKPAEAVRALCEADINVLWAGAPGNQSEG